MSESESESELHSWKGYSWEKVYAVRTDAADPVKEGDKIEVEDANGGSIQ